MRSDLSQVLAEALEAVKGGQSVEAIVAGHPELAEDLRPLLEAAILASSLRADGVPTDALRRSRLRFLGRADNLPRPTPIWHRLALSAPRRVAAGIAILVAAILGAGGITSAAAQALPGDILYPVKLAAEDLALLLSADSQRRLELETIYAEGRVEEVTRLLALGRVVPLSFEGVVVRTGPVIWDVGGVPVRLTPQTRILGEILPGMVIEVEGLTQTDGTFLAHELHLHQYDLLATLEARTEDRIVVGGEVLALTRATWLESGLAVGDLVLVRVVIDDSGERSALSVARFLPPTPTAVPPSPTSPPATPPAPTPTEDRGGKNDDGEEAGEDDEDDEEEDNEPEKVEFVGVVQSKGSSQWVVSGRVLRLTSETEIRDDPGVGDTVKVKALILPDGVWVAQRIELED